MYRHRHRVMHALSVERVSKELSGWEVLREKKRHAPRCLQKVCEKERSFIFVSRLLVVIFN